MKNALLAGASGLVGKELLHQLLEHPGYKRIFIIVRKQIQLDHPKLNQLIVDFDKIEGLDIYEPIDEVFCTLGTTIKKAGSQEAFRKVDLDYVLSLGKFCEVHEVRKFLVVSAMGADASSRIFYNRVKGEMEQGIQALGIPMKFIFRPSLLLGDRKEFRLGERIAQALMTAIGFLFIGGLKKYRAVHARTVAKAMINVANSNADNFLILDSSQIQALGIS
jgi:uncharacterized protein YbjT (DUF2867 family)